MELINLYELLRDSSFPQLGRTIGAFVLYNSLIAGYADRVSRFGQRIPPQEVPMPDAESVKAVEALRLKPALTSDEAVFLQRFDLLERIRLALERGEVDT